jgi:hypothetical protein
MGQHTRKPKKRWPNNLARKIGNDKRKKNKEGCGAGEKVMGGN